MGFRPSSDLVYGYSLGCPDDDGWDVAEADRYGEVHLPWFSPENGDVLDALRCRILRSAGIPEQTVSQTGWMERGNTFPEYTGLDLFTWGHREYPWYGLVLAGRTFGVPGYAPHGVVIPEITVEDIKRLLLGLNALEITPKQTDPGWLLVTSYG